MFRIASAMAVATSLMLTPVLAQSLADCGSMGDDAGRLACYDALTKDSSRTNEHVEALQALRNQLVSQRRNNAGSSAVEEIMKRQSEIDAVDRALADERSLVAE